MGGRSAGRPAERRKSSKSARPLLIEGLEERVVLSASLAPISATHLTQTQADQAYKFAPQLIDKLVDAKPGDFKK